VPLKGIKVAKQADAVYREYFEELKESYNQPYYWMDGDLYNELNSQNVPI
jgi:5'-nucleotidase